MNKLILLVLSLTSLVPAQEQPQHLQFRDLITPIAALKPRATGGSNTDYNYGDCDASFTLVLRSNLLPPYPNSRTISNY